MSTYVLEPHCLPKDYPNLLTVVEDCLDPYSEDVYFCSYTEKKDDYYIRVGFKYEKAKDRCKEILSKLEYITLCPDWEDTDDPNMEHMKFLAYELHVKIQQHFQTHQDYYLTAPSREYTMWGRKNNARLQMNTQDWLHLFHHLLNMQGMNYEKEVWTYDFVRDVMRFSELSNLNQQVKILQGVQ